MKRSTLLAVSVLIGLLAGYSLAFAIQGRPPKTADGTSLQNASAISPVPAGSRCDTSTGTKGTLKNYTTAGYTQFCFKAVASTTGAAVVVKRRLNANTAYMPGSGDCIVNDKPVTGNWAINNAVLDRYSAPSNSVTTCVERQ